MSAAKPQLILIRSKKNDMHTYKINVRLLCDDSVYIINERVCISDGITTQIMPNYCIKWNAMFVDINKHTKKKFKNRYVNKYYSQYFKFLPTDNN